MGGGKIAICSPHTDELIREICALGGRERLEREFGWRDGPGKEIPLRDLHARLNEIRNALRQRRSLPL